MPDEPILREKARAAIQTGKLPSRIPDRLRPSAMLSAQDRCALFSQSRRSTL
jgi:hypothetical protein